MSNTNQRNKSDSKSDRKESQNEWSDHRDNSHTEINRSNHARAHEDRDDEESSKRKHGLKQ